MKKFIATVLLPLVLIGCKTNPDSATVVSQPATPISRTLTSFTQAKACMDKLLMSGGRTGIPITVDLVEDATGSVKVSTRDMIMTALSDMSVNSHAFRVFVTPESMGRKMTYVAFAADRNRQDEDAVRFYIRGSISQADNAIASDNNAASLTLSNLSIGASESQTVGTITLDLQIADLVEQTLVHGTAISNTITVVSAGDQTTGRGLLNSSSFGAGLSVSLSSNTREGKAQAVRNLIDFSVIEVIGRFTGVPYWRCFQLDSTNPIQMKAARATYDAIGRIEQVKAVKMAMRQSGEYQGSIDGNMTPAFKSAVSASQSKRGLIPNGRVDFQLYNALVNEGSIDLLKSKEAQKEEYASLQEKTFSTVDDTDQIGLKVDLLNAYPNIGDNVYIKVSTDEDARLYCYYQYYEDNQIVTARIFPTRFQENNFVRANQSLTIPDPDGPVALEVDTNYLHKLGCVATQKHYRPNETPGVVLQDGLKPLQCDYPGVSCAVREHQLVDNHQTVVKVVNFQARK